MQKNITELIFILDRSGSMQGMEKDTIGGFNSMIEKQKKEDNEAIVSTILFDHEINVIHDRINLKDVHELTKKEYYVGGSTALLDAIGFSINRIINDRKNTEKGEHPSKTIFVITTDGEENSSTEFTFKKIKTLIKQQKEKYGWEFIFLGANIDSIYEASKLGIDEENAVSYHCDSQGIEVSYECISEAICCFRKSDSIGKDWRKNIDDDYKKRK